MSFQSRFCCFCRRILWGKNVDFFFYCLFNLDGRTCTTSTSFGRGQCTCTIYTVHQVFISVIKPVDLHRTIIRFLEKNSLCEQCLSGPLTTAMLHRRIFRTDDICSPAEENIRFEAFGRGFGQAMFLCIISE